MTRIYLSLALLCGALLIPAASAEAKKCSITTDAPIKDLRAQNVTCKVANAVAAKYQRRCMGAPCKITVADRRWTCEARSRTVCTAKGDRKVTWLFAGGEHG